MQKLSVLALLGIVFFTVVKAFAQPPDAVILAALQSNPKLKDAEEVLAEFRAGEPETGVIVRLKPSAAAEALAAKSRQTARVPEEFNRPGAPAFYNLRNESVKKQLAATVAEHVGRAIKELDPAGMKVKQKFRYQFGFAARTTPAALLGIISHPDVIEVSKDRMLEAHLAQGIPLMNAVAPRTDYPGAGLSIAVCDTGIDTSHPRLGNGGAPIFNTKVIGGYDTGDDDADPRPNAVSGNAHGTACAGIAAGDTGTEGDYIGGVAPGAKLYALKISYDDTGIAFTSAMIAAWEWAVTHQNDDPDNPIMIISTSFGSGGFTSTCDDYSTGMTTAAANAVAAGITIFVSSGNDGYCDSISWPACISHVNSVGAVYDAALGTYGFCVESDSCIGTTNPTYCDLPTKIAWDTTAGDKVTSYSNSASFLTLFAPSHNAYTADIAGPGGYDPGDYDPSFGGTSAACPYAAGAAAVLQSAIKTLTGSFLSPAEVQQYLVDYGDAVTDSKAGVTKPRINLAETLAAATPAAFTLTVTRDGTGSGTVSSSPPGIDCGTDCSEPYDIDTPVTLTAAADTGSTFTDWSGDCTGTGQCIVTMDRIRSVTATFTLNTYTITANASGSGSGMVDSAVGLINYSYPASSGATSIAIEHGTEVTVAATADVGSTAAWSDCTAAGGSVSGNGTAIATCTFSSLTQAETINAVFTLNSYTITANASGSGSGLVDSAVGLINYSYPASSGATSIAIEHGTEVTVAATADVGSTAAWSDCTAAGGSVSGNGTAIATCTFSSLAEAETINAVFTLNTYTITANASGSGSGLVDSAVGLINYSYPSSSSATSIAIEHGTEVAVAATADVGSTAAWSDCTAAGGSVSGNGTAIATCTFAALDGTKTINGFFTPAPTVHILSIVIGGRGNGSVTSSPGSILCPGTCSEGFDNGTPVTLTAAPENGSSFAGWAGDCTGKTLTCEVTVDQSRNVTAEFKLFPWNLFFPGILMQDHP